MVIRNWIRTNRIWLFALIFSVAGTYFLVSSNANPVLPAFSDDIVAGYINLAPTSMKQDEKGNLSYEIYSASTYVLRDGSLVCDSGTAGGQTVQTGTLTIEEVAKLSKDLSDTDVQSLPDQIATNQAQPVVHFEGFLVGGPDSAKGTAVYPGAEKPVKFAKAQDKLTSLCTKATRTEERSKIKSPRAAKLKNTKKTAMMSAKNFILPTASACCNVGTRDPNFEAQQAYGINSWRTSHGRRALPRVACLDAIALDWANKMTNDGYISHRTDLGAQISSRCSPYWRTNGENVGFTTGDSAGLMDAFINSPAHNANLLDFSWYYMGIGAVRHPDGRTFVTQNFGRW